MPKICYVPKTFSPAHLTVIATANQILTDYAAQGYDLTLRQLYYQFVARTIIPNKDTEYKRLGSIINDARLAGLIDWGIITDRTRNLRSNSHWGSPQEIVESCGEQYRIDKWQNQDNYVEVWVEKDALVGVLEVACKPLDVAYFSCRGYTSQSEMWVAAMRLLKQVKAGKKVYIIHMGDHDPSGIDMSRDIEDRVQLFLGHHSSKVSWFKLNRIALNMNQVEQYNPPPNPAKLTDARAQGYIANFGDESWELDALEPAVLNTLITETVTALRDEDAWKEMDTRESKEKEQLVSCAEKWEEVCEIL